MAQKNLLPYILLGMIEKGPKTGYDLNKEFDTEVGEFWSAKHSQIYLELKRLLADEEIRADSGFFGNKIKKTYYQITEKGLERFHRWENSYDDLLSINKDEFVLKLYFIKDKSEPRLKELLNEQLYLKKAKLSHLKDRRSEVFPTQKQIDDNYGHYLILDHAIRRETEYIDWLEESLRSLP